MSSITAVAYESVSPVFLDQEDLVHELRRSMFVHKDPTVIALAGNPAFPERADYFPSGFFRRSGSAQNIPLGGISDWAVFIAGLAKFSNQDLSTIFEEPREGEFMEILAFPLNRPCRHFIGPKTSAKLLSDFKANGNRAMEQASSFVDRYRKLTAAFEIAAKAGAVDFTVGTV
jgi:hypothetical protein